MLLYQRTKAWFTNQPLIMSGSRKWDQHRLEAKLARIFQVSNGHQLRGLEQGATEYVSLWYKADQAVSEFCVKHRVKRDELETQIPSLLNLQHLATAERVPTWAKRTVYIVAAAIACMLVGVLSGLISVGYHLVPFTR